MELFTADFSYHLPESRIAMFPSEQRDQSKLLVYRQGNIEHAVFRNVQDYLPQGSLLVFNNSKVIPARLKFKKESGGIIEIFLLRPKDNNTSSSQHQKVRVWECAIGNKKRWKRDSILKINKGDFELHARLIDEENSIVQFTWSSNKLWDEVLQLFGDTPLPPYIKRETVESDKERYQTIYSDPAGAVAAPTAGLHFTPEILSALSTGEISTDFITLHVGAGTFQPIKNEKATDHPMHEERIIFTRATLQNLIKHSEKIICVGTTSCRSLESLYLFGVKLLSANSPRNILFEINQHYAYQHNGSWPTRAESLDRVLKYMSHYNLDILSGETSIYIYPGYKFMMTDGLITNFHQPNSTLLLLIAALVGDDWKRIYDEAISSNYRFLSYGDSSLLFPQ